MSTSQLVTKVLLLVLSILILRGQEINNLSPKQHFRLLKLQSEINN